MKSLILLLFLGATVALAEIHVENDPNGNKLFQGLVSLNSQFPLFLFCPQLTPNFLKRSAYGKFTIKLFPMVSIESICA